MLKKLLLILSSIALLKSTFSQQQNLPLNREFNTSNQKKFNSYNNKTHTSFQPVIQSFIDLVESEDSITSDGYLIHLRKENKRNRSWFTRKLFFENFIVVDTGDFYLTIDPLFNLTTGTDREDDNPEKPSLFTNTRGIIARGNIGNNFSFQTALYENQATLPNYLTDYVNITDVVPGQGRIKNFKESGFDYNSATAYISYSPAKFINLQLGNGKNFIGDGYRSLLLSDLAYNYPYFKISTLFGKKKQFQFTKLNASLSNLTRRERGSTAETLFTKKSMSTHYFSISFTKWLNIGFFESTIWQTEDSLGTKPTNFQQLNPIPYINTLTTGFESNNHSIIGSNLKIKTSFKTIAYGQIVYNGSSKYGYQVGAKYFGIPNLFLQLEYNKVSAFTYSSSIVLQSYSHFNEALAHPLGNGFDEVVGIINYKYRRFFTQFKINIANTSSISNNIFLSENQILSLSFVGNTKLTTLQTHIGYLINPKNNMSIMAGLTNRNSDISNKTNYIYISLRTALRNLYSDF